MIGDRTPIDANLLIYAAPQAAELIRPTVSYFMEQQALRVSQRNLVQVQMLGRCGMLASHSLDEAAQTFLGYRIVCPDGGSYHYEAEADQASCSVHGSLYEPNRLPEPPAGSPLKTTLDQIKTLTAHLQFTKEGLESTVEIRRGQPQG